VVPAAPEEAPGSGDETAVQGAAEPEREPEGATQPESAWGGEPEPSRRPVPEPVPEPESEPESEPVHLPAPEPAGSTGAGQKAVGAGAATAEGGQGATRFCPGCQARVAVAADGLHCRSGHRLSPAHARRRFGLFGRG
jgi:hypothetical protein